MTARLKIQTIGIICIGIAAISFGAWLGLRMSVSPSTQSIAAEYRMLPIFTKNELKAFDGTDAKKPVYIGMDGLVYDVSPGRSEFYDPGMPYHYLTGRDASIELHFAGGGIIKQKYHVIGTLK